MLAIAIPAGLLIGLSLGALGGGGSILTVPALVYLLHQSPRAATTGSLLIVGLTALAGMAVHYRAGGVLGVAGSYAGTRLATGIKPDLLLALFAGLMLAAAAAMLRRPRPAAVDRTPAEQVPPAPPAIPPGDVAAADRGGRPVALTLDRPALAARPQAGPGGWQRLRGPDAARGLKIVVAAMGVGLLTGFFGVGGGFVIVPALVLALGFAMPAAVGTSLLVIAINSAAALAARLGGQVHLDWPLLGVFMLAALAGALAGNRIASRVDAARLTAAFTTLLVAVAIYTLCRSVPGLA
jgi:uncharacterized protein